MPYDVTVDDPLIGRRLGPGTLDLCVGEAHLVRQSLKAAYPPDLFELGTLDDCTYQHPSGWPPLVDLLERRTNGHVVVTCGAKQALCAVFAALRQRGLYGVSLRSPYWSQMYSAIVSARLRPVFIDRPLQGCAHLVVSPNNPDGHVTTPTEFKALHARCVDLQVPLVHDAAYHDDVYTTAATPVKADVSIHSVSKATGMSGLRVGYVSIDPAFGWLYEGVMRYVEATSVGVSLPAQWFLHELLAHDDRYPSDRRAFVALAQDRLDKARRIVSGLDPNVLDVKGAPDHGMFGWYKVGRRFDPREANVHVAPGRAFGDPTKVRLNLAVPHNTLRTAVARLNAVGR